MPDPVIEDKDSKEEQSTEIVAPEKGQAEKFEGKSTEEILKSYQELSKKLGEQGSELGQTRKEKEELAKNLENWEKLGEIIESDPELFKTIKGKLGVNDETDKEEKKAPDESKLFIRDNIIDKFEDKYGIKALEAEKKEALQKKIGAQLQLMLDPYGTGKDINELMLEVPLNRLPMYFENAYKLATADDVEEQARLRGMAEANANSNGMIGSIPSSSANSKQVQLTDKQKEAAKKLNVPEEDYIKYLEKE